MPLEIILNPKNVIVTKSLEQFNYVRGMQTNRIYKTVQGTWRPCTSRCRPRTACTQHLVGGVSIDGEHTRDNICVLYENLFINKPTDQ